jgi:preprotein translocase subunit SecY
MNWQTLNPAVDKKYLLMTAGLMWCGVGVMLILFAESWLIHFEGRGVLLFAFAGILAGLPIHFMGFLKLARKNIYRLTALSEKKCFFSFITWKSYLIIVFMVTLGITLRHSSIPKQYLSILYNGIGLGLFLSGTVYIATSIRLFSGKAVK